MEKNNKYTSNGRLSNVGKSTLCPWCFRLKTWRSLQGGHFNRCINVNNSRFECHCCQELNGGIFSVQKADRTTENPPKYHITQYIQHLNDEHAVPKANPIPFLDNPNLTSHETQTKDFTVSLSSSIESQRHNTTDDKFHQPEDVGDYHDASMNQHIDMEEDQTNSSHYQHPQDYFDEDEHGFLVLEDNERQYFEDDPTNGFIDSDNANRDQSLPELEIDNVGDEIQDLTEEERATLVSLVGIFEHGIAGYLKFKQNNDSIRELQDKDIRLVMQDEGKRRLIDLYSKILRRHWTEAAYVDFYGSKQGWLAEATSKAIGYDKSLPTTLKTLRTWIETILLHHFFVPTVLNQNINLKTKHNLLLYDPGDWVRFWLGHPVLGPLLVHASDEKTLPFIGSIETIKEKIRSVQAKVAGNGIGAADTTPNWYYSLLRTEPFWRTAVNQIQLDNEGKPQHEQVNIVFLHMDLFYDCFPITGNMLHSAGIFSVCLQEFGYGLRSSNRSPVHGVMGIVEKSFLTRQGGIRMVLQHFVNNINKWTEGKMVYTISQTGIKPGQGKAAFVVVIPTLLLGDSPGRAEASGYKLPSPNANRFCSNCMITAKERVESSNDVTFKASPRTKETWEAANKLKQLNDNPSSNKRKELEKLGKEFGIREWSPLRSLHGMQSEEDYSKFISLDFMHLLVEGVGERLFRGVVNWFIKNTKIKEEEIWTHLSTMFNSYQKFNSGIQIGRIVNEKGFKYGLNAASKLKFMRCTVLALWIFSQKDEVVYLNDANVFAWSRRFHLWKLMVKVLEILWDHWIDDSDLELLSLAIPHIVKEVAILFTKDDITPNLHFLLHMPEYVKLTGVPRNTAVWAMESLIGKNKRVATRNGNNHSTGSRMTRDHINGLIMATALDDYNDIPLDFDFDKNNLKWVVFNFQKFSVGNFIAFQYNIKEKIHRSKKRSRDGTIQVEEMEEVRPTLIVGSIIAMEGNSEDSFSFKVEPLLQVKDDLPSHFQMEIYLDIGKDQKRKTKHNYRVYQRSKNKVQEWFNVSLMGNRRRIGLWEVEGTLVLIETHL